MVYAPIWKDTYYQTTSSSLQYRLYQGSSLIYSGNAIKMPGETNIRININKICRDYLSQDIYTLVSSSQASQTNSSAYLEFTLKNASDTTLETYGFLFDFDKTHNWNGGADTLSIPVNGEYVSGGWRPVTSVSSTRSVTTSKSSNNAYDKVVCADYGLIYLNARGGWDAFYFTGKCIKTTDIKYYTTNRSYVNTTPEFEVNRYASEVTDKWELNTGLLSEEESKIYAKHLATSNRCYLHNVIDNTIIPVVITDTTTPVKTEESEDGGLISYKTNVKSSQIEYRL